MTPRGVVAVDLRGHGNSHHDPTGTYAIATHAEDISAVLNVVQASSAVVIGHSLGASAAISLASNGACVRGLVLVDGGPELNSEALAQVVANFRQQPWTYASREKYVEALGSRLPLVAAELLQEYAHGALRQLSDGTFRLKCDAALAQVAGRDDSASLWQQLKKVSCPILLVRGAWSALLTRAGAASLVRGLQGCRSSVIPRAGHAVMLDNPAGFCGAVLEFLVHFGL